MTISTIKKDLIYGSIIFVLAGLVYYKFTEPPQILTKTVTKVVTQVKTVEKIVTKDRIVYLTKKIITRKKNGDVIIETDNEHSQTDTHAQSLAQIATQSTESTQVTANTLAHYSIEYMFSPVKNGTFDPKPTFGNSSIELGVRVLDSPFWAEGRIEDSGKTYSIGLRYEF